MCRDRGRREDAEGVGPQWGQSKEAEEAEGMEEVRPFLLCVGHLEVAPGCCAEADGERVLSEIQGIQVYHHPVSQGLFSARL